MNVIIKAWGKRCRSMLMQWHCVVTEAQGKNQWMLMTHVYTKFAFSAGTVVPRCAVCMSGTKERGQSLSCPPSTVLFPYRNTAWPILIHRCYLKLVSHLLPSTISLLHLFACGAPKKNGEFSLYSWDMSDLGPNLGFGCQLEDSCYLLCLAVK